MQRKIACYLTAAVTVAFMVLRTIVYCHPDVRIGVVSVEDLLIGISLAAMIAIAVLCHSKTACVGEFTAQTQPTIGWIATFGGAVLLMSTVLECICRMFPFINRNVFNSAVPNLYLVNNVDRYTMIFSILFGVLSGIYLIIQGFKWMSRSVNKPAWLSWMSLSPVLWMWFRLARYEISYASTIDISHSFFDFAVLVTGALFFLQLSKAVNAVQDKPKNLLIICALYASFISFSGVPLMVIGLIKGTSITSLLTAIVDIAIGLLSFLVAVSQIHCTNAAPAQKEEDEEEEQEEVAKETDASLAWVTPAKQRKPLDPPFSIDEKLPILEAEPQKPAQETPPAPEKPLTVDDILAELNKTE
ncbi:MAG: hypothetical protein E7553_01815 [Ruminococcaceae bacterium]|nr:hypothetical protein [Oscillospiraceae bacterium]